MQSLLRWSIENSSPDSAPSRPQKPIDTGLIDYLMGPSPAQQMEDALTVATDETIEEGEDEDEDEEESTGPKATRMQALANLEMLVQDIDNAKHLTNKDMKMWKQLQELLTSSKTSPNIIKQTLWVIGTAIQNSPESQNAYLALNPISAILSFMDAKYTATIRSKAVYALSALLKHNAAAVNILGTVGGWEVFRTALEDSSITVRRKISFLINLLLLPSVDAPKPSLSAQNGPALHTPATLGTSTPLLAPSAPTSNPAPTVHPNSHASIVTDPPSANTSPATLKAMREHKVLDRVVATLVDGKFEVDNQVQENCVKILHTFAVICDAPFTETEKSLLRKYSDEQSSKAGGDKALAQSWDLGVDELKALKAELVQN